MQNPFLYAGRGRPLRPVTKSNGNVYNDESSVSNVAISEGAYSEVVAAHDCQELLFEFVFDNEATGTIVIEKVIDQAATDDGYEYDTITVTAKRTANWNAGEALNGFFRFYNNTDQPVTGYCQKKL